MTIKKGEKAIRSGPVGILLAAGNSRRFGADKLAQPLDGGERVAVQACRNLLMATDIVLAVVRPASVLAQPLRQSGARVLEFAGAEAGMGASLARGVAAAPEATGWIIALADMPWIAPTTILAVAAELVRSSGIVAPSYRGQRGHPVGFSASFRDDLLALKGDQGAKPVIQTHLADLSLIDCDDPGVLRDIDQPSDLA